MSSIDVVVPCYRYGRYLRECVQSVLSQGVSACRILIIDDESPDDTPQVAQALASEDSRVTYRRHTVNCGHIATYNEGIAWCESDYMLLLSADDYLLPGALQRAMRLLDEHPTMGLCFGEAIEVEDGGARRQININVDFQNAASIVLSGSDFIHLCAKERARNIVPTPTALVRTALLKQIGGYHTDLPHSADMELWLRLAAHAPVGILKADQAAYRRHAANMSSNYFQDNRITDLQQRKAAFDIFLEGSGRHLPDARVLYESLMKALALEAVAAASMAFNDGRQALSEKICKLAEQLDPRVRKSTQWRLLSCKKLIGIQVTNALRPIVAKLR